MECPPDLRTQIYANVMVPVGQLADCLGAAMLNCMAAMHLQLPKYPIRQLIH